MTEIHQSYDVIVVGSGIGGLAAASLLARLAGKRVLVLERHFKVGGLTHSFRRKRYSWDPGLHYVGNLQPGGSLRALFDLVTAGEVDWLPLPDHFDRFIYPELDFRVSKDSAEYLADLQAAFPAETEAIAGYFRDVKVAAGWYQRHMAAEAVPALIRRAVEGPGRRLALTLTGEYLKRHFRDPRLRALLVSQWGDYGLPPSLSAFAIHALIVDHYLKGAWYPAGGGGVIAAAVCPIVAAAGGACLVNAEVLEILVDRGIATGVRVALGTGSHRAEHVVRAPLVISDAGADVTYNRLLRAGLCLRERSLVAAAPRTCSAVQLFVGLDRNPRALGVSGENVWIAEGYDHDAAFDRRDDVIAGRALECMVAFPSLKDPAAIDHTAEIIAMVDHRFFAEWSALRWKRRGSEYDALKARISEGLLELVERHLPGFRGCVAFTELATPLTMAHFTGTRSGSCYGQAVTPDRLRSRWLGVKTPVKGLLLAGSDAAGPGLAGALMGGVLSAATVLGPLGFVRIMRASRAPIEEWRQRLEPGGSSSAVAGSRRANTGSTGSARRASARIGLHGREALEGGAA